MSQKVLAFKLTVTLSNLNRFQNFYTAEKYMKFTTKLIRHYPSHLRHLATLPWKIKNSNFLQIFSRYGRKCKHMAVATFEATEAAASVVFMTVAIISTS